MDVDVLLKSLAIDRPKIKNFTEYFKRALVYLNVDSIQDVDTVKKVVETAVLIYKEELRRKKLGYKAYQHFKHLPYEKFVRAVELDREGLALWAIELETGVSHHVLNTFRHWWKDHLNEFDPNDLESIYRAFLARNIQKPYIQLEN